VTEDDLRRALRQVDDPLGTPARAVFFVLGLAAVGAYAWTVLGDSLFRTVALAGVPTIAVVYAGLSFRARRRARDSSEEKARKEFLDRARRVLAAAPSLPFRGFLWLALGGWAGFSIARGRELPLGGGPNLTLFVAGMGLLLGSRYLVEWLVEIPRLRRDLEAASTA
jgi:hypothetical protein